MDTNRIIVKVMQEEKADMVALLKVLESQGEIKIDRISNWRSAGPPYADILITLFSAGSLTAIGSVIKTWLVRKRGKIEITSETTGLKVAFEGNLTEGVLEKLQDVMESQSKSTVDKTNPIGKEERR